MKIAVVGATGLVGQIIIEILEERSFPVTELIPVASESSVGQKIDFKEAEYSIVNLEKALLQKPDFAFFSAGGEISLEWAPKFAETGTTVIDNSSAWRLDPKIKLIVPEVNGKTLTQKDEIIANPNCSTIQLVMALKPLHRRYNVKRVIVSTYQSVTGSGRAGSEQLENEEQQIKSKMTYPYNIHHNVIPHCDDFEENGYTKEEMKLTRETK
ncbi:MAG TPA: aspartate-semialdehyde dehydrogenase, partial [Flavobacteriaceae bacterium]|nr:aspartate-semialdehyde dehydrogenase [Flavobacteriaceae bacterium]